LEDLALENLDSFRSETGKWLEQNCPPSMRKPLGPDEDLNWGGRDKAYENPEEKLWLERMAARGFTTPTWPKLYGGGGLSNAEARVLAEEMRRLHCRPALVSFGITMLGPVLLQYGNEEQKNEHLPKIVRGEIRWCQGYSEPGAGSDLAALKTRAERAGDHYIVNGSKIWTTYAQHADWMFCLVRTEASARRQDGISFLLIDMKTPGIRINPIISRSCCRSAFAIVQPPFNFPTRFFLGTDTSEKKVWQNGDEPLISLIGATDTPGERMSNSRNEMPSCFAAVGFVRTRQKIQSA